MRILNERCCTVWRRIAGEENKCGGSHVTFRSPIPSHRWRQEERHDQMGIAQSDQQASASAARRRPVTRSRSRRAIYAVVHVQRARSGNPRRPHQWGSRGARRAGDRSYAAGVDAASRGEAEGSPRVAAAPVGGRKRSVATPRSRPERDWNYDVSSMRDMTDASPRAAWLFSYVTASGQFRRDLPIEAWGAAGMTTVPA
jgi:hypothetical protein